MNNKRVYLIHRAINKYRKENFEHYIIDSASTNEEANNKEIFWINFLDTMNKEKGYNLHEGGVFSGSTVKLKVAKIDPKSFCVLDIYESLVDASIKNGKTYEGSKSIGSSVSSLYYKAYGYYWVKYDEDLDKNLEILKYNCSFKINTKKSVPNLVGRKKIVQLEYKTKKFIKIFDYSNDVLSYLGKPINNSTKSALRAVLIGKRNSYCGFHWSYLEDYNKGIFNFDKVGIANEKPFGKDNPCYGKKRDGKKCIVYRKDDSMDIKEFNSLREASEFYNMNYNSFRQVAEGNRGSCHGYIIKYK